MPNAGYKHPFDRKDQAPRRTPMEPDEIVGPGDQIRDPGEDPVPQTDPEESEEEATLEDAEARMTGEGGHQPEPGTSTSPPPPIVPSTHESAHEGATEEEIGDRTGPRAGYDDEPEQEDDRGGVR